MLALLLAGPGWAAAAETESNAPPAGWSSQLTNIPAGFRVQAGFRLELAAAEAPGAAPAAIAFDENGRLFVAETLADGDAGDNGGAVGRVRLLEDPDGTGQFRSSRVYADKLAAVSAVACYGGGVFVAAGAAILYLKDAGSNGIATVRREVFSGFESTNALAARMAPHSFTWGLDNHIHAAGVGTDPALPSRCFSFAPRGLALAVGGGGAEAGLALDNWGRALLCDPARPLRQALFPLRYRERNPFFPAPPEVADVLGPAATVFQLPPGDAAPPAAGFLATNAPTAAWLTNARSCVVYRGHAFPTNFQGNVFIADASARVIHRVVLREAGLRLMAERAPDDARGEFLMSADPAFRPVQVANGPDGALYVVAAPADRAGGRIYRIVPQDFKPPKAVRLGRATTAELVAALAHPNGWHRDTAARLLYERQDPAAAPALAKLFYYSRAPLTRAQALYALEGLGALSAEPLLRALKDPDARVREQAVRLAEARARRGALPAPIWGQLKSLAADPSLRVRYQLALTLGEIRAPDRAPVLAELLWEAGDDPWRQAAVLSSLGEGAAEVLIALARQRAVLDSAAGQELLDRLAAMIGAQGQPEEIARMLAFADQTPPDSARALPTLAAMSEGLRRAGISLARMNPQGPLPRFYAEALAVMPNVQFPEPVRLGAIRLLPSCPYTYLETADHLLLLAGSRQSEALRSAALATLGSYDDPRLPDALLRRWRALTPALRADAAAALLARADRLGVVLDALEEGRLGLADLTDDQVTLLRAYPEPAIAERAARLLGPLRARRPEALQHFQPALNVRGAADRGRGGFLAYCAVCHQPGPAGPGLGPELATAPMRGKEWALAAMLEPSAEIRPGNELYLARTAAGELFWGRLRDDHLAAVTLQQANGQPVVLPRLNLRHLAPLSGSLMPEALAEGLSLPDMADLLEYLAGERRRP
ncbi:MAG TPA: HEAT repeat domain-containing protein [Verrucomicrobiota bacterium]|nr:HEAT repeat domain-containing protein [Verrucomicrobiota bacterium]